MRASDRVAVEGATCQVAGRELRVVNLSLGGFFVEDPEGALPPGQFVACVLRLPRAGEPLGLVGKVAWRREGDAKPAGYGVQITRIELREKLALVDWLRRQGD